MSKFIKILMVFLWWGVYTAIMPICLVISMFMRLKIDFPRAELDDFLYLNALTQAEVDKLDTSLDGEGQDKCKFVGMRYFSTNNIDDWNAFYYEFVDETTCMFTRGKGYEDLSFSGDMYVGASLAIATALKNNHITVDQRIILAKVFENLTYGGYIPFRQPHEDYSRGYQSMPPICNGMAMNVVNILKLGATLNTGATKWLLYLLYMLFALSSIPLLIFGCYDRFFWLKWIVGIFSYNTHSDMVLYKSSEILGIPFARSGINYIYKVHGHYNVDYQVLSGYYDEHTVKLNLARLLESRSKAYDQETKTVFSIKGFEFIDVIKEIPIGKQCHTYDWEKFGSRGAKNSNKSQFSIIFAWNCIKNKVV